MRSSRLIIALFIIAPLIFSFSFFKSKKRDYEDMANKISAKVAKKLVKRHGMDWIGEGGGIMQENSGLIRHIYPQMEGKYASYWSLLY